MDDTEQRRAATLTRRSGQRADAIWKLGALLVLVLLMADVLTRQIGLLTTPASAPVAGNATANFFKVQVGDFRAEIQWSTAGTQE